MPYPTAELHLRGSAPIRVTWMGHAPAPLVVFLGVTARTLARKLGRLPLGSDANGVSSGALGFE